MANVLYDRKQSFLMCGMNQELILSLIYIYIYIVNNILFLLENEKRPEIFPVF